MTMNFRDRGTFSTQFVKLMVTTNLNEAWVLPCDHASWGRVGHEAKVSSRRIGVLATALTIPDESEELLPKVLESLWYVIHKDRPEGYESEEDEDDEFVCG